MHCDFQLRTTSWHQQPNAKKTARVSKHTASQGRSEARGGGGVEWWQGQFLQSRIRMDMSLGFALEGTIRNISFLPKVDCVI